MCFAEKFDIDIVCWLRRGRVLKYKVYKRKGSKSFILSGKNVCTSCKKSYK